MKGFVSSFAKRIVEPNHFFLRQVMDYFNANDLGVYASIASPEFVISGSLHLLAGRFLIALLL
jgi:hypothetical protein